MPFITQERRKLIHSGGINNLFPDIQPGDRCYCYYKRMVDEWRKRPGWTTAHEIYCSMRWSTPASCFGNQEVLDDRSSLELAWQVFFQLHVMPYEEEKRKTNGDI